MSNVRFHGGPFDGETATVSSIELYVPQPCQYLCVQRTGQTGIEQRYKRSGRTPGGTWLYTHVGQA